jgi:hypothetical protein
MAGLLVGRSSMDGGLFCVEPIVRLTRHSLVRTSNTLANKDATKEQLSVKSFVEPLLPSTPTPRNVRAVRVIIKDGRQHE